MALKTERSVIDERQAPESLWIDRLLYYLRLAKTRTLAARIAKGAYVRVDGERVSSAHQAIRVGQVLTVPAAKTVRVVRILVLPHQRGDAGEARSCYEDLASEGRANDSQKATRY